MHGHARVRRTPTEARARLQRWCASVSHSATNEFRGITIAQFDRTAFRQTIASYFKACTRSCRVLRMHV